MALLSCYMANSLSKITPDIRLLLTKSYLLVNVLAILVARVTFYTHD